MAYISLKKYRDMVNEIEVIRCTGQVVQVIGLTVEAEAPAGEVGEICHVYNTKETAYIPAEIVGFRKDRILLMPYGELNGIGPGSKVVFTGRPFTVAVGSQLIGRILDGLGNPMDGGAAVEPERWANIQNVPPHPLNRQRISKPLVLGVRAIDGLLTCGQGQRLGIFAGSGVGKSTLLGMIARNTLAEVNVIALIGERGREVREFIEKDLKEGLKRSVIVVATSDQPPLMRLKAAFVATTIAEFFREKGKNVLLMMDSLTRFAMAQREVGLAIGEPPVSRGYTPSVFSILPKLLERVGNGEMGSITGLYTVLVDGDDFNEPISDAVRGILDGHILLSRRLANRNHYPAIDVLGSVSRVMPDVVDKSHMQLAGRIKALMAAYEEARDLINIGAYRRGSNPEVDEAIEKMPQITEFLQQAIDEKADFEDTRRWMERIAGQ
ncbi:flagellar protein export ATPase FliI [Caldicoprobacter algeriensis]|uniref:flagellar protein export ATPase FliI n=1 Tax=Caldicoprobacter algeriensis TaxID=699281 RepID=UPI00207A5DCE|nr:flagellar protein export ATPase FliI [Caldicoprobacter algeriensis]MCM8901219.1 flagellar protein export ATPase FliI [Caldicoprobacter algeriensis]